MTRIICTAIIAMTVYPAIASDTKCPRGHVCRSQAIDHAAFNRIAKRCPETPAVKIVDAVDSIEVNEGPYSRSGLADLVSGVLLHIDCRK